MSTLPKQPPSLYSFVLVLVLVLFGGLEIFSLFSGKNPPAAEKVEKAEPKREPEPAIETIVPRSVSANPFIFKGHSYISFKVNSSYGDTVIHDPDCPCKEQPLPLSQP